MPQWVNWSRRLESSPKKLAFIRHEDDARGLAKYATDNGLRVRTAGGTHSHVPLVGNDDVIADCRGLSGVISANVNRSSAWVWAGSRIYTLGRPLHELGLALMNQGDIDEQTIAGATATGTHGTGDRLSNLSSAVTAMEIATSDGNLTVASYTENPELLQAARLHLGAFGIVTKLELQLMPSYRLSERMWQAPLEEVLSQADKLAADNRHFEFFWYPHTNLARAKTINQSDALPEYPLADEGERIGWSYEVLPNHRPHKHTEMEYSVPLEHGQECMLEIKSLLARDFPDVDWPVEYRFLAEDDVWLSTAYERPTVTISVHQDVRLDEEKYYRACEEIFLRYGGRPHWGKVHYLSAQQLADAHPRWHEWWRVRDAIDPNETFLNDYLSSFRPR